MFSPSNRHTHNTFLYLPLILVFSTILSVETRVCPSLDVRNTPEHISEFKHCRVIEGHLQVVLIERSDDVTDFFNNSFTELHEITDYLIVFRVKGLPSLDVIFPNLASIKGKNLFLGYALVLYDLLDLEEVKLTSLRSIGNGAVKIHNSPNLCYVDTVDWARIGSSRLVYDRLADCKQEKCPNECQGSCWNDHVCQRFDKSNCHPLCIGCTKNNSPSHCIVCKYFNNSGTCVQNCPQSKLTDNKLSRCLTDQECAAQNRSIFKSACISQCPDFYENNTHGQCVYTKRKVCSGMEINGHVELEQMIDCTHIIGSLEVVLYGYIDSHSLERALGNVVNITGYLKIARSHAITTLASFKSLKVIKGEKLWSRYYSLFVVDNQNLQELFHVNTSVVIEKGEALFQNNPYLCPSEINRVNVTTTSSNNGGYTCKPTRFSVTMVENNSTNVTIRWTLSRNVTVLGGYTVYYIKSHFESLSPRVKEVFFDKEGHPFEDAWNSVFVRNNTAVLLGLTPYTYYKYYIKTMLSPEKKNRQSLIYEFKTAADDPSEPVNLEAESQSETTVTLKWDAPRFLNGNLSHYNLTVYREDDYPLVGHRDFCLHPYVESTCNCPAKDDVKVFLQQGETCMGPGDNYCNAKTVYQTEVPKQTLKITKRSIKDDRVREYVLNSTTTTFVVDDLQPFTMYTFFMQACNEKDKGDKHHCGGFIMTFKRTPKRRGVDVVTDVTTRVENKTVFIQWVKPNKTNSAILAYRVEYRKVGVQASRMECRTSENLELNGLEERKYECRVAVLTLAGYEFGPWEYFDLSGKSDMIWVYIVLGLLGVGVVSVLGLVIWRKYQEVKEMDTRNLLLEMRVEREPEDDEWKLDEETVEIIKELGQNYVGMLYRNY